MKYQNLVDAANENLLRLKQEQLGKIAAAQSAIVAHLRQHPLANTIAGPVIETLCKPGQWLNGRCQPQLVDQAVILLRYAGRSTDADAIEGIGKVKPIAGLLEAILEAQGEINVLNSQIARTASVERWMNEQPDLK